MIVTLLSELFEREETDRLALLGIMDGGRQRYRVQLRPAYRAKGDQPFHQWLNRQDPDLQKRILPVFERGLRERDFGPAPMIDVHCFGRDEWQNDPKKVPIRLCIDTAAEVLIRPLRLLLENGRNDWGSWTRSFLMSGRTAGKRQSEAVGLNRMSGVASPSCVNS